MILPLLLIMAETTAQTPTAAPNPPAAQEEKVCKRYAVTGSLVASRKVCKTRKEWARSAETAREEGENMRKPVGWNPEPGS